MWTGKYVSPKFRKGVLSSSSVSSSPTDFLDCFNLKMKTVHPFETLVTIYQSSWRHKAEGLNLHRNRCEHLRFLALSCFRIEMQLLRIYFSSFIFSLSFSVTRLNISSAHKCGVLSLVTQFHWSVLTSFVLSIHTPFLSQFSDI